MFSVGLFPWLSWPCAGGQSSEISLGLLWWVLSSQAEQQTQAQPGEERLLQQEQDLAQALL